MVYHHVHVTPPFFGEKQSSFRRYTLNVINKLILTQTCAMWATTNWLGTCAENKETYGLTS